MPFRSDLLSALALALAAVPSLARAELPDPAAFPVRFSVLDPSRQPVREMTDDDLKAYVNLARCECGQPIRAELSLTPAGAFDPAQQVNAYVGTECDVAEADPDGQFRPCGGLTSQAAATYADGTDVDFHPLFLGRGIAGPLANRAVGDPATVVEGGCAAISGDAGVWLCAPLENGQAGCQTDEFFRHPQPKLRFDFTPPLAAPIDFTAEPGDRSVRLHWSGESGDIQGYRILCADAAGAPIPGLAVDPPEPTAPADGTHYFTAHDLCGDSPFTSVMISDPGGPAGTCGDGVLDENEECDDDLRGDDHLCAADCTLRVSAELYALDWDYVCSDHLTFDEREVAIGGLENGESYQFVLVSHDRHGNPRAFSKLALATPRVGLPQFAPDAGCDCDAGREGHVPGAMLSLALLGLARRRRAARATG